MTDLSAARARLAVEAGEPRCPCGENSYFTTWDATGLVWSKRCMYCGTQLVKDGEVVERG